MEEQSLADRAVVKIGVDDPGDRHGVAPLRAIAVHRGPAATANEAELTALRQDAAIGARETAAAVRPIGDHLTDGELTGERLALAFEIDADREALKLAAAGF
jgi:hypothetical protein